MRELVKSPLGRDPALLLKQEGASRFCVDLSTRECDGHVVVALGGELDLVDAADVAAALVTVAAREPEIIVDLAGLEFIDSSGVAALARGRKQARHAGGDLLLAAPGRCAGSSPHRRRARRRRSRAPVRRPASRVAMDSFLDAPFRAPAARAGMRLLVLSVSRGLTPAQRRGGPFPESVDTRNASAGSHAGAGPGSPAQTWPSAPQHATAPGRGSETSFPRQATSWCLCAGTASGCIWRPVPARPGCCPWCGWPADIRCGRGRAAGSHRRFFPG